MKGSSLAIWALGASAILLASCDRSGSAGALGAPDAEIVHPIREALRSSDPTLPVSDVSFLADDAGGAGSVSEALSAFDAAGAVGMAQGPDEVTFGSLRGGTILSDGRIAVVDRDYGVVRLFTASLEPRGVIGGFGDGPGEFVAPVALLEEASGTLVVVNHVGSRIRLERFRRGEDGYGFHERTLLPLLSDDSGHACTAEGRVFVTGLRTSTLEGPEGRELAMLRSAEAVHEVDGQGRHIRSLAPAYTAPFDRGTDVRDRTDEDAVVYALAADVEVAMTYSRARLACGDSGEEKWIWVAYSNLGEVHGLTLDGELRWVVRLPDMRFLQQVQRIYSFGTSVGSHPDQGGVVEYIGDIFLISSDLLAVQIVSMSASRDTSDEPPFRTVLLDPVSGELRGGFRAKHRVLAGGHGTAVLYREELHPELAVVQLRR